MYIPKVISIIGVDFWDIFLNHFYLSIFVVELY